MALDGSPSNRTVVFRGFHKTTSLMFYTDKRSDKCLEFQRNPMVELCWYFSGTREQFRIKGTVEFIMDDLIIKQHWDGLSPDAKEQYIWALKKDGMESEDNAFLNYGLFVVHPLKVTYLNLYDKPHGTIDLSLSI
jgi:hypothetical protein